MMSKRVICFFFSFSLCLNLLAEDNVLPESKEENSLTIEECYSRGRKCLSQEEYEQANEWFKKAEELLLKEESERSLSRELRAEQKQGNVIHKVEQNIIDQAGEAFAGKKYALALEFYQYALESAPDNKDIYFNTGLVYLEMEDYEKAARAFSKVLDFDGKDAEACYNLAVIYENHLKDFSKALSYYKKYVSLAESSFDAEQVKTWISYLERSTY